MDELKLVCDLGASHIQGYIYSAALPQADVRSPFEVERLARLLRPEHVAGRLLASSDPDKHRAYLQRLLDLGFNELALHNVGPNQREWIEVFGREVLPGLHT